jgi:hypothetical protein
MGRTYRVSIVLLSLVVVIAAGEKKEEDLYVSGDNFSIDFGGLVGKVINSVADIIKASSGASTDENKTLRGKKPNKEVDSVKNKESETLPNDQNSIVASTSRKDLWDLKTREKTNETAKPAFVKDTDFQRDDTYVRENERETLATDTAASTAVNDTDTESDTFVSENEIETLVTDTVTSTAVNDTDTERDIFVSENESETLVTDTAASTAVNGTDTESDIFVSENEAGDTLATHLDNANSTINDTDTESDTFVNEYESGTLVTGTTGFTAYDTVTESDTFVSEYEGDTLVTGTTGFTAYDTNTESDTLVSEFEGDTLGTDTDSSTINDTDTERYTFVIKNESELLATHNDGSMNNTYTESDDYFVSENEAGDTLATHPSTDGFTAVNDTETESETFAIQNESDKVNVSDTFIIENESDTLATNNTSFTANVTDTESGTFATEAEYDTLVGVNESDSATNTFKGDANAFSSSTENILTEANKSTETDIFSNEFHNSASSETTQEPGSQLEAIPSNALNLSIESGETTESVSQMATNGDAPENNGLITQDVWQTNVNSDGNSSTTAVTPNQDEQSINISESTISIDKETSNQTLFDLQSTILDGNFSSAKNGSSEGDDNLVIVSDDDSADYEDGEETEDSFDERLEHSSVQGNLSQLDNESLDTYNQESNWQFLHNYFAI